VKLAHLADPHLGFRQYYRQTATGQNQREMDVSNAFRAAMDGVIAARPDIVVIAGDLFHSVRPTNQAILFAFHQFRRLREALPASPVVLIAGNHDTPRSVETGSILRLFETLGVHVVDEGRRKIPLPQLNLSVLAVSHDELLKSPRVPWHPEGPEAYQVLVLHGEVEGVFPVDRSAVEYGGAGIRREELTRDPWSYVALGHYHVRHEVAPRVWYSGALEYVSSNPWGELEDEAEHKQPGKGWILADLDSGRIAWQRVPLARRVIDLPRIDAEGLSAAQLDGLLVKAIAQVPGGIADQVVRQVVRNIPLSVGRSLDHPAIRAYKAEALHYQLDLRRPETRQMKGMGSPGKRATLPEIVEAYLSTRPLPGEMDRQVFVRTGVEIMSTVEREMVEG
jgi:DNA repair exonuclease SbcCD nuclease subunit